MQRDSGMTTATPSIQTVLSQLRDDKRFVENVVAWERIPPKPAREADFPANLDASLCEMLQRSGIKRLYTHQAQAEEAALNSDKVVAVTPTASGQTPCYKLPALQTCLNETSALPPYLFP